MVKGPESTVESQESRVRSRKRPGLWVTSRPRLKKDTWEMRAKIIEEN